MSRWGVLILNHVMSRLDAVLFDMDGVLLNSAPVANRLLVAAAARHGVQLSMEELEGLRGVTGPQFWSYVKRTYHLPGTVEEYWASYDAEAEVAAYDADLIAPGVRQLIEGLDLDGVSVGIVTSASRWRTRHVIELLDIDRRLSAVVCSDDVDRPKPDPQPYLRAAERLDVEPVSCVAVEDSYRGAQSALGAGMAVLAFTGFEHDQSAALEAHAVVDDFRTQSPRSFKAMYRRAMSETRPRQVGRTLRPAGSHLLRSHK